MSRPSALIAWRSLAALVSLLLTGSLGCWEQWSNDWWPQMKWQRAIQAFEPLAFEGRDEPLSPPEGTVPIGGGEAPVSNTVDAASDHLENPQPMSLGSLENGRVQYEIFCAACHGTSGVGDGPVSMTGPLNGPFAAVLPIAGPGSIAKLRSDGHLYTTIRYGRIPSADRWDIVNYVRYLDDQKGVVR